VREISGVESRKLGLMETSWMEVALYRDGVKIWGTGRMAVEVGVINNIPFEAPGMPPL
jgi:hypothetical protein